jgi:HAE1 family hydrophobic/amphiphilic exporter-1
MGIAAKNAILLVEFAIEAQQRRPFTPDRVKARQNVFDSVFDAVRERARPIVMTTVAMSAGMVPTALGLGEGAGFRTPMAIAVIGGLISSTVLSLMLVPVMYSLIAGMERKLNPFFAKLTTRRTSEDDTLMHKANNTTPPPEPAPGTGD